MIDEIIEVAVLGLSDEVPVEEPELLVAVEDGVGVSDAAPCPSFAVLNAEMR